jgi:regulator of nucleoside diphosphate kinase
LYVTDADRQALNRLISDGLWSAVHPPTDLDRLGDALARRQTVPSAEIPSDVITLGSQAQLLDLATGDAFALTLVLPDEANIAHYRVSVLAPMGMALLGQRVGATFECPTPAGIQRLKVLQITYQPEAWGEATPESGGR